ncbi:MULTISPECIES: DUF397 domain-containing protein [Streptomyces]|uniref:DUF397 domain-containing protein n=1 Tax=Streptomyces evansiae TaxID=3075535 RepID=A0ABU2R0V6_9ACTN|nr:MULTISPECIES: DUF397 domain-containing protein [unclassified Streptomyces]EFL02463.1 conserved hypothetical protein [Streptomyces sp. SPB78]MDT0410260.1 DUF397 domain-containing protein [Streptomyces sp. DSM 41979]MYQ58878.1 DUF397 domain-containing protein [Streptomyces sp. SID4926]SCE05456.1 protein of unknown function [Streptomyces sp. DfronAA-171]
MSPAPQWRTSSYSGNNGGACIQVATNLIALTGAVPVRDSKRPAGGVITVGRDAFSAFIGSVRTGRVTA